MDTFLKRTKRKSSGEEDILLVDDNESTDVKLMILSSLHSNISQEALLEALLAHDGSVQAASASLADDRPGASKKQRNATTVGYQTSLKLFTPKSSSEERPLSPKKAKLLSKKGATLHLYDPEDIAENTPCSIVHNFLPPDLANDLLKELLDEAASFEKASFKLFDNVVQSPHTSGFYVGSAAEVNTQKHDYYYNGAALTDIRCLTPQLLRARPIVQEAVNKEIQTRMKTRYPGGRKLKYQSPDQWLPNCAFVNCYNGPQENLGYHSDQPTYIGPRAVIGSLSLGVAREFRVRRIVPKDSDNNPTDDSDAEGQISIHLPHNSLLVMHAEMQEEWKHSIAAAQAIDPHPIAGNRRINITYRDYKSSFHPKFTPRCKCRIPAILRVVQRKKENHGKYFWMCHHGNAPGKENCSFFQWADFDDNGNPSWDKTRHKVT
ncbi:GRF zinc finger domain-containing protein [Hypoxylon trugodes]|uniref:GRF zinc finger domain-containing protein n=1 Tax=Hypoxylon trugodes TaxID=326681 RepID=UPI002196F5DD|nr:GRF zinc finger domain-containing protein [Hypoxylon trugodes]KAI1386357.1 GRF zinc finger domain-containing protein [Hypoxylon trugodes]